MRDFRTVSVEDTLAQLKTSKNVGLSSVQASERLKSYGLNALEKQKKQTLVGLFFAQFGDIMTLLLIAAAAVSAVIAFLSGESGDLADTLIIISIIFMNAVVGCIQQYRADKAIQQLKKLSVCKVKTLRGGKDMLVDSENITVGDIIRLEEGDLVPADCRIISCSNLFVDESALTGESLAVEKNNATQKEGKSGIIGAYNALFSSTFVTRGNAVAVVTGVGMNTEIGAVAGMINRSAAAPSPLERSLNTLGKIITGVVLSVTAIIFGVSLFGGGSLLADFMSAVAIAVAAIPEGLPAVVTVIMAMGVQKMSKRSVVIRKLKSVEALGSCNVICTDKTGTLTCNKMKVVEAVGDENYLLACMGECCNVLGKRGAYIGDTTEIALKNYADSRGYISSFTRVGELPFTSERKLMSVSCERDGKITAFVKGAPDILIKRCVKILENGEEKPLSNAHITGVIAKIEQMSAKGLRSLAFAYGNDGKLCEEGLTFIGLCGMSDRLKSGVKEAVAECKGAGIKTVMITGDHALTAFAIAKEAGIADDMGQVVTGEALDGMGKNERRRAIINSRVFARVTPKHKNLIVKVLQGEGDIVAMTGDGVNDAPSIKSADIGIAMGVTGTDVTKSVSDMVISDDNFATIVTAVREGRRISANIKKTIGFFISTNLAEVLAILIATLFFAKFNFLPSTQLLWLNLITDSFPVLALGMEREDFGVMKKPPERAEKALFSKRSVANMLYFAVFITAVTVGVYAVGLRLWGNAVATTVTFLTLSFCELFHAFNVRAENASAFRRLFSNRALVITVLVGVGINVLLCLSPLKTAFDIATLNGVQWLTVFICSLSVIFAGEIYKLIKKLRNYGVGHSRT